MMILFLISTFPMVPGKNNLSIVIMTSYLHALLDKK